MMPQGYWGREYWKAALTKTRKGVAQADRIRTTADARGSKGRGPSPYPIGSIAHPDHTGAGKAEYAEPNALVP